MKCGKTDTEVYNKMSLPSRGARVEIAFIRPAAAKRSVAPLAGSEG